MVKLLFIWALCTICIFYFLINKIKSIMSTAQDVKDQIAKLQTSVDTLQAKVDTTIKALEAKISAGVATPEELQEIVDSLKTVQEDVDSTPLPLGDMA